MIQGSNLSAVTSFYTVSRLLQVIGGKGMFNSVAEVILYPDMTSSVRDAVQRDSTKSNGHAESLLSEMGNIVSSSPETEGAENTSLPTDTVSIKRLLNFCFSSYKLLSRKKRAKK